MQSHSNVEKNALFGILMEVHWKLDWINYHTTFSYR